MQHRENKLYLGIYKLIIMSELYNYVFHYNHFTELWSAIPRDKYNQYWDNDESEGILQSKEFTTLVSIIVKDIKL